MRKASFVLSAALAFAGVTGTVGILLVPSVAMAQQKVSAKVGVPLKAAQDAIQKKKWDQALTKIKEADGISSKTAFDQYKINDMLWYVYLQQGRNADAARVLEGQINSGQMPAGEKGARTKTLAQLYFRAGNYGKAAQLAKTLPGDKDMQMIVATAAYQQKDYKGAIAAADRVIKAGGQPSQELLQLVLRCNYELKDSAGTTAALEQLLKYYPSTDTWSRVLEGYFQTTKHDHELMALYRLSEDTGTLTKPRMYTDMSQAMILGGFAIEGERIIQKGLAANLFTGDDLNRAQRTADAAKKKADAERALLPKAAGMLASAKSGEEMYTVGKLYFSNGEYAKASDALTKAIAKGGIQDADAADMLLAVALARQGKKAEAGKAFDAIKDPKFLEIGKLYKMAIR
jgi:tetratricopeptide (TPR) repeat protein